MRPIIASISSGVVSIWAQNQVENWSAFAPDFKELDENVEYEERESEFDLEDEDKINIEAQGTSADDEIEVDCVGVNPIPAFCSSDEEDEQDALLFLPIAPDIEDAEDQWAPPPDPMNPTDDSHSHRRSHSDHKENHLSTKKKKPRTYDIALENAPTDGKKILFTFL
jgi:COMPASS component SWD1